MQELRNARLESLRRLIDLGHKLMLERNAEEAREWIDERTRSLRELQGDAWALNDYLDSINEWLLANT